MAALSQMKDPLRVGKAIRAQLEQEIPTDLPLDKDFKVNNSKPMPIAMDQFLSFVLLGRYRLYDYRPCKPIAQAAMF
jgi:hypothetical protein